MASKEEIVTAIRAGNTRVAQTFGALSEAQLATVVNEGAGGWTAKQVLAHLAARQSTYDLLIRMAGSERTAGSGGFDIDAWNQKGVDERQDRSRDALLEEFRTTHERLAERAQAMPDVELLRTVALPQGSAPLGDVLRNAGGAHSVSHAVGVEKTLGLSAPSA